MATVYEYRDYKIYLRAWLNEQPRKGRGLMSRMAEHLAMSSAMLSQIFNSDKNLSPESANDLALFLGMSEEEIEYFLLLVNHARAGTHTLRERLKRKIIVEQQRASELIKKLKPDRELPEVVRSTFYSHWLYTGVRNMTACEELKDVDQIAKHLKISRSSAQRVVDFLLQNNLCVIKNGRLDVGPQITHVAANSPLAAKHHENWRLHGLSKMFDANDDNVFFTSPMSLSKATAQAIRLKIPSFVEEIRKLVGPSDSEVVRCLNIDWFQY